MPTWRPSHPKSKPFDCNHYWHLRKSGLFLATYDLIGALTAGGKNKYISSIRRASVYFGTDYESQRRVFAKLRKLGWLELVDDTEHHRYIAHKEWAEKHPGQCFKRELSLWQLETDPLVGKLWALFDGKLRVREKQMEGLRKYADSDEEILALATRAQEAAKEQRAVGDWKGTAPTSLLNHVYNHLKNRSEQRQRAKQIEQPQLVETQ